MTPEQSNLLELLKTFADICERYGLQYYLAGGTLLGAIRHQGFIPWDDDIDVMMPLADYEKFLALESKLNNGLVIQSDKSDDDYPFLFVEFCDTNILYETQKKHGPWGIYIDIFPLISSKRPNKLAVFYFNIISVINYVLQVRCGWTSYIPYKRKSATIGYGLLNVLSKQQLRSLRRKLASRLFAKDTDYLCSIGGGHKGAAEFYLKSWFSDAVFIDFEDRLFPVQIGWDEYLKQLYGNYMIIPDESQRRSLHKS